MNEHQVNITTQQKLSKSRNMGENKPGVVSTVSRP